MSILQLGCGNFGRWRTTDNSNNNITNGTTDFHPFGLLPWREEEYNVRNRKQNKNKKSKTRKYLRCTCAR
jgi:hypothetical protein